MRVTLPPIIPAGDLRDVGQHARDAAGGVRHPRPVPQPARQLRRPPRRRPRPLEGARHVQGRKDGSCRDSVVEEFASDMSYLGDLLKQNLIFYARGINYGI